MGLSDYIKQINFKLWPQLFIMEHSFRCLKYFEISYAQCQYSKEHRFSKIVVFIKIKCNKNLPPFYKNFTPAEAQKLSK